MATQPRASAANTYAYMGPAPAVVLTARNAEPILSANSAKLKRAKHAFRQQSSESTDALRNTTVVTVRRYLQKLRGGKSVQMQVQLLRFPLLILTPRCCRAKWNFCRSSLTSSRSMQNQ